MNDLFAERIYGVPWLAFAGVAALIAVVYVLVPNGGTATGAHWFVLRWFHSIAWAFFALAALARSKVSSVPVEGAAVLAATGGLVYVVLMLTTLAVEAPA